VVDVLSGKMGSDILLLDISQMTIIADYFVIATAESERQLDAMATGVVDELEEAKDLKPLSVEGTAVSGWILLDYGGIIVHLFDQVRRDHYQLEALWREAHVIVRMA
jgi:ribosome-associated protein